MTNPFTIFPLDILSNSTPAGNMAEYQKMPLLINRFSFGTQLQSIRARVRHALAELAKEARIRMRLAPVAPKMKPTVVPVPRPPIQESNKPH